jgi:hypothetical protein
LLRHLPAPAPGPKEGKEDNRQKIHQWFAMRRKTSYFAIFVLCGALLLFTPEVSVSQGFPFEEAEQTISSIEDTAALGEGKGGKTLTAFGRQIAGVYVATRDPDVGPSRILTIYADGNLTSIQSIQFGGGVAGGFSNQQGVWKRVGPREIQATVTDFTYEVPFGDFIGGSIARYNLQFDRKFQNVTGTVEGKIFTPGISPLNPGEAEPVAEFSDAFEAQRIAANSATE